MTDRALLQRYAGKGDAEAFGELVRGYQGLVFATCRRVLYCPEDLEDAVQEVFLRLATKAGEIRSNLGAWLHRCAMNVAMDFNRRGEARRRHEKVAAKPAGAVDELSEGQKQLAELREQVDAALAKLAEDQRELLVQRYLVGRPMGEIAAEMGITGSALTYRLEKAVESLRSQMASAGCMAGAGVITAMMEVERVAQVPQSLTGSVMKIGLKGVGKAAAGTIGVKVAVIAAGLVVGGAVWVGVANGKGNSPVATTAPAPASAPVARVGPAAFTEQGGPQAQATAKWEPTVLPAKPAALSGRVTDDKGNPVEGARVELLGQGGPLVATTGKDGRYSFATIANDGEYAVQVKAEGYLRKETMGGYWPQTKVVLSKAAEATRDLTMDRSREVVVTVLDEGGNPVEGATVQGWEPGERAASGQRKLSTDRVTTDVQGMATIDIPVGMTFVVAAVDRDLAPTKKTIKVEDEKGTLEAELIMPAGHEVRCVVMGSDGKPVAGRDVLVDPVEFDNPSFCLRLKTDAAGAFVAHVGEEANRISVLDGSVYHGAGTVTWPVASLPVTLKVLFPSTSSTVDISAKVKISGHKPSSVTVRASCDEHYYYEAVTFSDKPGGAEGRLEINGVTPGTYRLEFDSSEIVSKTLDMVKVPGEIPVIELVGIEKPVLAGRVVDGITGKPLTQFAVRLMKVMTLGDGPNYVQDGKWLQVANAEGKFTIGLDGPGVYQAQISADGYAWPWSEKLTFEAGRNAPETVIKVTAGGSVSGKVVDDSGNPVVGAKVIPFSMARSTRGNFRNRFGSEAGAVLTDAEGRFVLPHLAAGSETLKLTHGEHAPKLAENVLVKEGERAELGNVTLSVGGMIEGTVCDQSGKPEEGVAIRFQDASGYNGDEQEGMLASAVTDAEGHFAVKHLAERETHVWVGETWSRQGVVRQLVRPRNGKTLNLKLGGEVNVRGRLLDGAAPIAQTEILLANDSQYFGPMLVRGKTDGEGRFELRGVPAGRYTVYWKSDVTRYDYTRGREVVVGDNGVDLGEMVVERGDLDVKVEAEDPADLAGVRGVSVLWGRIDSASAKKAGDGWRADRIRTGHAVAQAYLSEQAANGVVEVLCPVDVKPGTKANACVLKLPRRSATLTAGPIVKEDGDSDHRSVNLLSEDGRVQGSLSLDPAKPVSLNLPPGVYRMVDWRERPIEGIAPIKLAAGETTTFTPVWPANRVGAVAAKVWSADGRLETRLTPHLHSAGGSEMKAEDRQRYCAVWQVPAGKYQLKLDAGDGKLISREVEVSEESVKAMAAVEVDLVVE